MGGPCNGQIHDLAAGHAEVTALDADGRRHVYVRTEAVDVEDDLRVIVFRLAAPGTAAPGTAADLDAPDAEARARAPRPAPTGSSRTP
jgi:hypothetical protein